MPNFLSTLLSLAFLASLVGANVWLAPGHVAQMKIDGVTDSGHATNCGKVPFKFSWTPKDIDPKGKLVLSIDYTTLYSFNGGYVNASLFFHGDSEPFIGYSDNVKCEDVKKYFPCPIPKGLHVKKDFPINDLEKIASFPGEYDGLVVLKNQDGMEMICMKLTVTIKSP